MTVVKPAMALILLAYKQEKYIAEAMRAAFAQDYSPLEIVISDDASPDGTWRVIEQEAARYSGPHRLILNRNDKNLGLIGNEAKAVGLSTAPYIVMAAGDDVSEPNRVSKIAACFAADETTKFVTSNFLAIFASGEAGLDITHWHNQRPISAATLLEYGSNYVQGCANAYSREVFDAFPGFIPEMTIEEDHVLPFRAALLGKAIYLYESLVRYRLHSDSITETWRSLDDPLAGFRVAKNNAVGFRQKTADLNHLAGRNPPAAETLPDLREKCRRSTTFAERDLAWHTRGIKGIMALVAGVFLRTISPRDAAKTFLKVNFARFWAWYVTRNQKTFPSKR